MSNSDTVSILFFKRFRVWWKKDDCSGWRQEQLIVQEREHELKIISQRCKSHHDGLHTGELTFYEFITGGI